MRTSRMILLACAFASICGCGSLSIKAPPLPNTGDTLLVDVSGSHSRLQVYGAYGSALIVKSGVIYTDCLSSRILNHKQEVVYEDGCSEADAGYIIDYSDASNNTYRLTECDWDYREECLTTNDGTKYTGLIEKMITVGDDGATVVSERVVLKGEKADPQLVAQLVQEGTKAMRDLATLRKQHKPGAIEEGADEEEAEKAIGRVFMRLRNVGADDPDVALKAIETLKAVMKAESVTIGCCCDDGTYTGVVERMKEVKVKSPKGTPR